MNKKSFSNRGQVTLFVIIGILILVSFLSLFFLRPEKEFLTIRKQSIEPRGEIKPCILESK